MTQRVRLELHLDLSEPLSGSLKGAGGGERRFIGWLDLLAALEAACVAARAEKGEGAGRQGPYIREVPNDHGQPGLEEMAGGGY